VQLPELQLKLTPHSGLVPHRQSPLGPQLSALVKLQETQAVPPSPQVLNEGVLHVFTEQHPSGHEVPSQTQLPERHRWPGTQAPCDPQAQVPPDAQLSAKVLPQSTHVAPALPQVASDLRVQVLPAQQPEGQDVLSQRQAPAMHLCPDPQGAPDPQAQVPLAAQASAEVVLQETQVAPAGAHRVAERGWQVVPSQHPEGQDVASQTHVPLEQRWPVPHTEPNPHRHSPRGEQLSACALSQDAQLAPPTPHSDSERVLQLLPMQQPFGQPCAQPLQTPA
jgi:hypothetical protein